MFSLPGFERLVVAALGLDHFACFRVLVTLDGACTAGRLFWVRNQATWFARITRINNGNNVAQVFAIIAHQCLKLGFKLDFTL